MWKIALALLLLCAPAHAAQLIVGLTPNATEVPFDAVHGTVVANLTITLNNHKPFTGAVQMVPFNSAFAITGNAGTRQLVVGDPVALAALAGQTLNVFIQISQ